MKHEAVKIEIQNIRPPGSISETEKTELIEHQNNLDEIYKMKAEGTFVRSRKRWLEEWKQNSKLISFILKNIMEKLILLRN